MVSKSRFRTVAFAAKEDFGEDYDAWNEKGVKLDLGTVSEVQATPPSGYFTGLKRGRWYWRVFALQDGVVGWSNIRWQTADFVLRVR